jgi:septum formation protein
MRIILASNSPRRKELLSGLGIDFEVRVKKDIKESFPTDYPTHDIPQYLARQKASAYQIADDELLITADTMVIVDNKALGKPHNEAEARLMLQEISGRTHQVVTGVCIRTNQKEHSFSVTTDVTFKQLADGEISHYITTYKPFDKAGAYGIQEWIGYIGVTSIHGSYFNVMGLPVQRIYEELKKFGLYGNII